MAPTRPSAWSDESRRCPPSSSTSVRPSPVARAQPTSRFAPVNSRDERARRRGDQLGGRPDLDEPALVEHADPVGERSGVLVVVRDERASAARCARRCARSSARTCALRLGIERAERLVEEEDRGLARERARERDALPLAARESAGRSSARRGRGRTRRSASATRPRPPNATFGHRQVREEGVVLEDEPDGSPLSGGRSMPRSLSNQTCVAERDPSTVGTHEPGERTQEPTTCPLPEGPTSASVSAPTPRSSRRSKERRAQGRSRE